MDSFWSYLDKLGQANKNKFLLNIILLVVSLKRHISHVEEIQILDTSHINLDINFVKLGQKFIELGHDFVLTESDLHDAILKWNGMSRKSLMRSVINPAIEMGIVSREFPDKVRHPRQRYLLTMQGVKLYDLLKQLIC